MCRMNRSSLTRYAWLSIAAALATIGLKGTAYWLTGSIGMLSDAAESLVNLLGAFVALAMLTVAAKPADDDHVYGHSKAEYFSSGVEGVLTVLAALVILGTAIGRFNDPQPIEQTTIGIVFCTIASVINYAVARILFSIAKTHESITLEADAHHLLTDVWTSVGVIVGVGVASSTGWLRLDPIVAMVVAANILWTGYGLIRRSVYGLMDTVLPEKELQAIEAILRNYEQQGIQFHALRTRQAASRRFVSVHVLVPGRWTVQHGHELLERIEADIRNTLPEVTVLTHLEPVEDPASLQDIGLDRRGEA